MPKKNPKKQSKSPKAESKPGKRGQPVHERPAQPVAAGETSPAAKKPGLFCQFCEKPMGNERTLRLHERHCRRKSEPKPPEETKQGTELSGMESAMNELRDQFRDQVEAMSAAMREREEQHGRELEEVRTVLRMEIDRHRKELERLSKVEKEVAEEKPPESKAQALPPPPPVEAPEIPQASPRAPDGRPRAIDMLPLPAPQPPRRHYAPLPAGESIPDIDGEAEEGLKKPSETVKSLSREETEALVREVLGTMNLQSAREDESPALIRKIELMESRLDRTASDIRKVLDRVEEEDIHKKLEKDIAKMSERVQDIMEDSGYGESLSVSKIPPTILEIVYQAILDDIHHEIVKTKGYQDAERLAKSALEEVRLKTSGSELFKFDGRKIITDSLAKSIEANLISAKQIQTTYDVLLDKLLETVPHYKAKNFKGMIKVKSQEFAVDRATRLTKDIARLEKTSEATNQMVAAMSANFNARNMELNRTMEEIRNTTLAAKADREEIEALRAKVEDMLERTMTMSDDIARLKATAEPEMETTAQEAPMEAPAEDESLPFAPGEIPAQEPAVAEPSPEAVDIDIRVMECVKHGKDSRNAVARDSGIDPDIVDGALARLVAANALAEKRSGKRVRYFLPVTVTEAVEPEPETEDAKEARPVKQKRGRKHREGKQEDHPETGQDVSSQAPAAAPDTQAKTQSRETELAQKPEEPAAEAAQEGPAGPEPDSAGGKPKAKRKAKKEKQIKARKVPKGTEWVDKPKPEAVSAEPAPEAPSEPIATDQVPEPPKESEPEQPAKDGPDGRPHDELPVIRKSLEDLSGDEMAVLEAISPEGMTVSGIQSKVGKGMKRFALLRALRVLIDSGHVGILTKGRMELYQRINVEKMDKTESSRSKKEVK